MPLAIIIPRSPGYSDQERQPVKTWVLVLCVALTIVSIAIHAAIYFGVRGFQDLFRGFGADLPLLTRIVMASAKYYGLLVLVGLVPCVLLLYNRTRLIHESNRLFVLVLVSFGLSFGLLVVYVIAAYLPIFQLGAVVQ